MKRFAAILMSGIFIVSAAACAQDKKDSDDKKSTKKSSSETSEEQTTEESTTSSEENQEEYGYYVEITWSDYAGPAPEFYIYDTQTEVDFGEIAVVSSDIHEGKGSVTLGLPACDGRSYYLHIETFDVNTGNSNLFGEATAIVKDADGNTITTLPLEDWMCLRGTTGVWYYDVCVFNDSGATRFDT